MSFRCAYLDMTFVLFLAKYLLAAVVVDGLRYLTLIGGDTDMSNIAIKEHMYMCGSHGQILR